MWPGPYQFTHGRYTRPGIAAVKPLFRRPAAGFQVDQPRDSPAPPSCDPEVASVGLTDRGGPLQLQAGGGHPLFAVPPNAIASSDSGQQGSASAGFVEGATRPGTTRSCEVTIVGEHAGELLAEFRLAMKWGLGLGKIPRHHQLPTLAEANKLRAGE